MSCCRPGGRRRPEVVKKRVTGTGKSNVITHLGNVCPAKGTYFATVGLRWTRSEPGPTGGDMRNGRRRTTLRTAASGLAVAGLCALTACASPGSSGSAGTFKPSGSMAGQPSAAAAGASSGSVTMPAFGPNVHIDLTSWQPTSTSQAQAVRTDKDYELAFL